MAAHVADEVGSDAPLYEMPLSVGSLEAVVVLTSDDGLERQTGRRLECGEVCAGHRRAGRFVDLDGEIGREVLGPGSAVVVDDDVVPVGLGRDQALDRPVARFLIGGAHARRA
jgi:hypothetical protein